MAGHFIIPDVKKRIKQLVKDKQRAAAMVEAIDAAHRGPVCCKLEEINTIRMEVCATFIDLTFIYKTRAPIV